MLKKQVLFVIHDLHLGGAEKVLVNLVNHMDRSKFDVTVLALFGGGVNEPFLNPDIRLIVGHKRPFPGNSRVMKLFSPERLFRYYIRGAMMPSSPIWRDPAPVLSVDAPGTGQSWYLGFTVPWNPRKPLESGFEAFRRQGPAMENFISEFLCHKR